MLKKLISGITPALLLLLLLTSCDPGVEYRMVIQNESSQDIRLTRLDSNNFSYNGTESENLTISPNDEVNMVQIYEIGEVSFFSGCDFYFDSLRVKIGNDDSLQLNFDINDLSRWNFNIIEEQRSGGGECECRMVILDDHIE